MRPRARRRTRKSPTVSAASTTRQGDTRRRPNRSVARRRSTHAPIKAGTISASRSEALGDVAQAQQHYLKAIALVHKDHPRYDVVYANFADLLIKLGNFQRAFDLAAEAAERNPERAAQLLSRRKGARQAGPSDLSVRWFEQAIALNADYPEPHYLLAQVYRKLGRVEDADRELKWFQVAAARAPKERR